MVFSSLDAAEGFEDKYQPTSKDAEMFEPLLENASGEQNIAVDFLEEKQDEVTMIAKQPLEERPLAVE